MTGSSDAIQASCFRYGGSIYVTWDYKPLENGGYSFQYIEMECSSSLGDVLNAVVDAIGSISDEMMRAIEVVCG